MMITIISTSVSGKRKRVSLLEDIWHGRRFEVGQTVVATLTGFFLDDKSKKGKIVGFNRPHCEGRTTEVLKVILEGEKHPRDLKTSQVQIIKGS